MEVVWVGHLETVVEAFNPSLVCADLALQCTRLPKESIGVR